jgi:hypothetical protein
MHIHFSRRATKIVLDNCSNSPRLVDIRSGVNERAVVHNIACFSRGSRSVDRVSDFPSVHRGCHRCILEPVNDKVDVAGEIYRVDAFAPLPTSGVLSG